MSLLLLKVDYADQTTLHPFGLAAVLLLGAMMMLVDRRHAIWPMLLMACFIAPAQRVVIAGLDFDLLRLMVLCGWLRIMLRGEYANFRWLRLDTVLVLFLLSGMVIMTLLHQSSSTLVNRLGWVYNGAGMYFLFRMLIQSWDDLEYVGVMAAWISIPVTLAFAVEHLTHRNVFAFLGGVPEVTAIRQGRLRCQGAFAHPILAGCFWASLVPLMAALWWRGGSRRILGAVGVVMSMAIIVMCASSTPVIAAACVAVGYAMFPVRMGLAYIRWSIVALLIILDIMMQSPVWHLIARISVVGGSTSWHRFNLINQAIERIDEWWLLGTKSTAHWGPMLSDVTNQYVLTGVQGGLLTLALLIVLIAVAFRNVGKAVARNENDPMRVMLAWSLGVSLFVHCASYLAASYFGQITMLWYLALAATASLTLASSAVPVPAALNPDADRMLSAKRQLPRIRPAATLPQSVFRW